MSELTNIPVFPDYEIRPYDGVFGDSHKFVTVIRKKHTDGLWYKTLVITSFAKIAPIEKQFKIFLMDVYIAQHLLIIHPTSSNAEGKILFEVDEDQTEERERLMRDYHISFK